MRFVEPETSVLPGLEEYSSRVIAVGLSGGPGVRSRPLTLKAPGYLRAKGAVRLLGARVVDWLLNTLRAQGVHDYIMVTKGKENRYQVKRMIGYGDGLGIRVRYSLARHDRLNHGSADATIFNLDYFDVSGEVFVFSTDSLVDFDLAGMLGKHRQAGAILTVLTSQASVSEIAGTYGTMVLDDQSKVVAFMEKPSLEALKKELAKRGVKVNAATLLPVSAGMYLLDADRVRALAREPELAKMRAVELDFGKHFLPWLVASGLPVYAWPAQAVGDLGNIPAYLSTMKAVLAGKFGDALALLGAPLDAERGLWIDASSLDLCPEGCHHSLRELLERGDITVGHSVRIGKYVQVHPGVHLSECNLDDECEVLEGAQVVGSSVGEGTILGPYCVVEDSVAGIMVELESSREQPTRLSGYVAVGDEVVLRAGVQLAGQVHVYPRVKIPPGCRIPAGAEIRSSEDVVAYL